MNLNRSATNTLRKTAACAAAFAGACCVMHAAHGQQYPSRVVRIVTAEAGGDGDFVARVVAQGLTESLGQQVIVDNRAGVQSIARRLAQRIGAVQPAAERVQHEQLNSRDNLCRHVFIAQARHEAGHRQREPDENGLKPPRKYRLLAKLFRSSSRAPGMGCSRPPALRQTSSKS